MGRKSSAPEKRQQIVQALYVCLSQNGHERATIKGIAEKAGLPHGVIHYYFKSKDEIVSQLMTSMREHYGTLWGERVLAVPTGSERVGAGIDFLVDEMILDAGLNRVLYNLVQMGFERREVRHELRHAYCYYREQLAAAFFPSLSANRRQTAASAVLAAVEGLALQWMIETDVFSRKQIVAIVAAIVSKFLKP